MKLVYTEQALSSLDEVLEFIAPNLTHKKLIVIRDQILDAADTLLQQPLQGQEEPFLAHMGLNHRRIINKPLQNYLQDHRGIYLHYRYF